MTNEEKELLLQDLCARLPYGVIVEATYRDGDGWKTENRKLLGVYTDGQVYVDSVYPDIENIKPYLRPMSSMTEEEITEIYEFARPYIIEEIKHGAESDNPDRKVEIENGFLSNAIIINELNKRHIDYHGLIPKGLALEALEDMYIIK